LAKDPKWNEEKIQDAATYQDDFVKDDRSYDETAVNDVVHVPGAAAGGSSGAGSEHEKGTAPWFKSECTKINQHCMLVRDNRLRETKEDLKHFQDDCIRQKGILADMKDHHVDQKMDIVAQEKAVAEAKDAVKKADAVVAESAHCPPELEVAKTELARLPAIANKKPADIDAECEVEKKVVELEKCVDRLRAAEKVLASKTVDHSGEKADLSDEKQDVAPAAQPIPAQEKVVADVCARFADEQKKPLEGSVAGIDSTCQAERDGLLKFINFDLDGLWQKYLNHKAKLEGKEDAHKDEKADVKAQQTDVVDAKMEVEAAKVEVAEKAHCPPELEAAKVDLARLRASPNKVPTDIDAECKAENLVLEKQKCVDIFNRAQAVLAKERTDHIGEKSALSTEEGEKAAAKAAIPPQEAKKDAAYAAWLAAKALYDSAICKA